MTKQIFINLPVRDLGKSKAFYAAIGAVNNPQFTDETAACMVWSDTIYVMLLTHAKWKTFTDKPIAAASIVSTASRLSTRCWPRPVRAAARWTSTRRRTCPSCSAGPSRTWTATSGSRCSST